MEFKIGRLYRFKNKPTIKFRYLGKARFDILEFDYTFYEVDFLVSPVSSIEILEWVGDYPDIVKKLKKGKYYHAISLKGRFSAEVCEVLSTKLSRKLYKNSKVKGKWIEF